MAVDKLVDSTQLDADLTSVANAIRTKGGTSAQMAFPNGFVSAVNAIPTGVTPTGTKQISITQNGTVTEDVTDYADAEITVDVHGGSLTPLMTINVTEDVRSIYVDLSQLAPADQYIVKYDLTLSGSDWLYYSTTNLSGGVYDSPGIETHALGMIVTRATDWKVLLPKVLMDGNAKTVNVATADAGFYIYTYKSNVSILSGGKIEIYDAEDI